MNDAKKYVTYKIALQFCKYKVIYLPRNGDPSTPLRFAQDDREKRTALFTFPWE